MPVKLTLILATIRYDIYVSYSLAFSCTVWRLIVMHEAPVMIWPNVKCKLDLWTGLVNWTQIAYNAFQYCTHLFWNPPAYWVMSNDYSGILLLTASHRVMITRIIYNRCLRISLCICYCVPVTIWYSSLIPFSRYALPTVTNCITHVHKHMWIIAQWHLQ